MIHVKSNGSFVAIHTKHFFLIVACLEDEFQMALQVTT
jgi:hypothetical protein